MLETTISSGSRFSDKKTNSRGGDSIRRKKVRRVGGRCEKGNGPIPWNLRFRVKDLGFQIKFPLYPSFFLFLFCFRPPFAVITRERGKSREDAKLREVGKTRGGRIQIECKFVGERVENLSAWKVKPWRRAKRRKRETLASKVLSRWSNLFSILPFSFSWLGLWEKRARYLFGERSANDLINPRKAHCSNAVTSWVEQLRLEKGK